jgi:predicted kinase
VSQAVLTLLAGAPAAGKSTWLAGKGEALGKVLSADEIRTHGADARAVFTRMQWRARHTLRCGANVVVDACSLRSVDREEWLRIAIEAGARPEIVVFTTPIAVCRARDAARPHPANVDWERVSRDHAALQRAVRREKWSRVQVVA